MYPRTTIAQEAGRRNRRDDLDPNYPDPIGRDPRGTLTRRGLPDPRARATERYELAGTTRLWFLRRFTTKLVNPVARLFAGRLPGLGILSHVGRTTGRRYRTPVFVHRHGDDYVFALTFGSSSQWVRNILAAGAAEIRIRGRDVQLVEPEVFVDSTRRPMPLPLRLAGRALLVTEFLRMHAA
jgi:deazaflavin-dependent oxidoreductase (nitroreductase family)